MFSIVRTEFSSLRATDWTWLDWFFEARMPKIDYSFLSSWFWMKRLLASYIGLAMLGMGLTKELPGWPLGAGPPLFES